MQPIQFFAARVEDGALLPGATVDVYLTGTNTRAELFSDSAGTSSLANPVYADGIARVFFYTTADRIDIRISRGGYVAPLIEDLLVTDPEDVLAATMVEADRAGVAAGDAQTSRDEAAVYRSEAELSATAALAAGKLFITTTAGLAATSDQEVFLLKTADAQVFDVYVNDGGIADLQPDQFTVAPSSIASPLAQASRISSYPQRGFFVATETDGALTDAGVLDPAIGYSIVAGKLSIDSGLSSGVNRYFWMGHVREAGSPLFIESTVTISAGQLVGPYISVGNGVSRRHYTYTPTGSFEERASNYGTLRNFQAIPGMGFTGGGTVSLRLNCNAEGVGYLEAVSPSGQIATWAISDVPTGPVQVVARNENGWTVDSFKVRPEFIPAPGVTVAPVSDRSKNLLPSDWLDGSIVLEGDFDSGWALGRATGAVDGDFEIVDLGNYFGIRLTDSRACRVRVPVPAVDVLAFHLRVEDYPAVDAYRPATRLALLEYASDKSTVLATHEYQYHSVNPHGGVLKGTFARDPGTAYVLFNVLSDVGDTVTVSYPCLAASDVIGFRPAGETLRNVDARVAVLEEAVSVPDPVLLGWKVLPNFPLDRDVNQFPSRGLSYGYTVTGAVKIPYGRYKGLELHGDDGRLNEQSGDAGKVYNPHVHLVDSANTRILASFPAGVSGLAGHSVQGVACDTVTLDTFWVATATARTVKHFYFANEGGNTAGTEIAGDVINFDALSITPDPNGVVFDGSQGSGKGAVLVGGSTGNTVWVIDADPLASPRVLGTITLAHSGFDQMQLVTVGGERYLLYSIGANGVEGSIYYRNLDTGEDGVLAESLPLCTAIEGFIYDHEARAVKVFNDAFYHSTNSSPVLNMVAEFKVAGIQ